MIVVVVYLYVSSPFLFSNIFPLLPFFLFPSSSSILLRSSSSVVPLEVSSAMDLPFSGMLLTGLQKDP